MTPEGTWVRVRQHAKRAGYAYSNGLTYVTKRKRIQLYVEVESSGI